MGKEIHGGMAVIHSTGQIIEIVKRLDGMDRMLREEIRL